jgi:hypothetical protein
MADEEDRSFHTSTLEANLAAEQGLGLGARELAAQRDPGEPLPADIERAAEAAEAEADEALALGRASRPEDNEHGAKTRKASKDIISGRQP